RWHAVAQRVNSFTEDKPGQWDSFGRLVTHQDHEESVTVWCCSKCLFDARGLAEPENCDDPGALPLHWSIGDQIRDSAHWFPRAVDRLSRRNDRLMRRRPTVVEGGAGEGTAPGGDSERIDEARRCGAEAVSRVQDRQHSRRHPHRAVDRVIGVEAFECAGKDDRPELQQCSAGITQIRILANLCVKVASKLLYSRRITVPSRR